MIGKKILGCAALLLAVGCDSGTDNSVIGDGGPMNNGSDPGLNGTDNQPFCQDKDVTTLCSSVVTDGVLRITEADNYYFESNINVTPSVVKPNENLTIRWDGLTTDLFGRQINPMTDIDLVLVSLWERDQTTLANEINKDILEMNANNGAVWVLTEKQMTQTQLFDMGIMGSPTEPDKLLPYFNNAPPYNPATWTHLIMAQTGTAPGSNARMLGFFTLGDEGSTEISLTPQSSVLTYNTNIRNQNWLAVPMNNPNLIIDYENIKVNVAGNKFVPTKISRIAVGHYLMNSCEIENNFLYLEDIADAWYEKELAEVTTSFSLAQLTDSAGVPFPGVDNTGLWIVALRCDSCANSAPWFLTVLHAC